MSRVNSVLVVHTVGVPSLSTVLNLYDLYAVALGKGGRNHVLAGSAGILTHLILSVGFPAAEGTYEVDTVIAYGSRSGSGFGSGRSCGLGSRIYAADIIEFYIIVTGAVLIGHVNAGSAGEGDIDRLLGTIVDDVVGHTLGHLKGVALLAHLVRVIVSHRNAGPFYRLIFLRPVVDVNSAEALVVGEDDGSVGRIGSRIISSLSRLRIGSNTAVVDVHVATERRPLSVASSVEVYGYVACVSRVNNVLIVHTVGVPSLSTVLNLYDLYAVALGKGGRNHVLAGSAGILTHLILSVGFPAAEGTYEVDTVIAYGSRSGSGFGSRILAADSIEVYFIFALAVEIGHVNAGRAGKRNINSLRSTVGNDVVSHALGHLEGESFFTEFILTDRGHCNAGPLYRLNALAPIIDMNVAEALIVREDNGSGGRIGSRNGIAGAGTGAGAIGSPTCYEIMTLIVLRAVHPVTVIGKVSDVLGLSAVTVAQDNADSILGNIALELSLAVFILSGLSHCGTGPFAVDRFARSVPSVDICAAPTEVVGQQEGGFNRIIGSRLYRTAGTVGVPAGNLVVTELVLRAVHPVTVIREVLDILGLLAVTVAQDNAGSALGNIASELSLAVLILSGLSLSGTRPCAVKLVAVIIPCIYICLTPTEVIGQQEGTFGIRIRVGTGSRGGIGSDIIEFYVIMTLSILIGHVNAGRTIERNIDSLLAAVVDDIVGDACGNIEGESLFAVFVHTDGGHRNAGPLNGLI